MIWIFLLYILFIFLFKYSSFILCMLLNNLVLLSKNKSRTFSQVSRWFYQVIFNLYFVFHLENIPKIFLIKNKKISHNNNLMSQFVSMYYLNEYQRALLNIHTFWVRDGIVRCGAFYWFNILLDISIWFWKGQRMRWGLTYMFTFFCCWFYFCVLLIQRNHTYFTR